jgi:MFS transporter, ACDE family, multidrug resistance protein
LDTDPDRESIPRPDEQWSGGARQILVLSCATAVLATLGVQAVAPAAPVLQDQFDLSTSQVGLFTAVYLLPGLFLAIPLGVLGDMFGRRPVFAAAAFLFAIAGVAGAFADSYGTLLALRFVQGIGFAAIMPLTITILGDTFRGFDLLRAQSRRAVALVGGDFLMPVIGTALAAVTWYAPLLAQGAMLPAAVAGLLVLGPRRYQRQSSKDYRSGVRTSLRQPGIPPVLAIGVLRFVFKFTMLTYLPLLLVDEHGLSLTQSGVVLGVSALTAAVSSTQVARLLRTVRPSLVVAGAFAAIAMALAAFAVVEYWVVAIVVGMAFGAGDGTVSVIQDAFVAQAAEPAVRSGVVSVSATTKNLGKLAAPLVMGALVAVMPIEQAFLVMAGVALGGSVAYSRQRSLDRQLPVHDTVIAVES